MLSENGATHLLINIHVYETDVYMIGLFGNPSLYCV